MKVSREEAGGIAATLANPIDILEARRKPFDPDRWTRGNEQ